MQIAPASHIKDYVSKYYPEQIRAWSGEYRQARRSVTGTGTKIKSDNLKNVFLPYEIYHEYTTY